MSSSLENILYKWDEAKKTLESLEEKIKKYKLIITKEMNNKDTDKLSIGDYTVTRRRNTRTYVSKETLPANIWKEYSTRCSYDAFFLVKHS
jgi:hypothetical protein